MQLSGLMPVELSKTHIDCPYGEMQLWKIIKIMRHEAEGNGGVIIHTNLHNVHIMSNFT